MSEILRRHNIIKYDFRLIINKPIVEEQALLGYFKISFTSSDRIEEQLINVGFLF